MKYCVIGLLAVTALALCGGAAHAACTVPSPPNSSPFTTATRLDTMTADAVKITGGCIDGVTIGGNTAAAATLTTLGLKGATSGALAVIAPPVAGTNTITLPAGTTDFSATGGAGQVVKQTSPGGAFTVGQLSASDISGISGGCSPPTDGFVMFGSSGCAGSANLTWDNTNQILAITGSIAGAGHDYALSVSGGSNAGTHIAAKFGDTAASVANHYTGIGYDKANELGYIRAYDIDAATERPLTLNAGGKTVYGSCASAWDSNPGGLVGCAGGTGGGGGTGAMLTGIGTGGRRFIAATDGSSNAFLALSRDADGTGTYHTLLHSSGLSYFNGGAVVVGGTSLTGATGELGILVNTTDPNSAPGATDLKLTVVCGTNAGSAKLVARAGTSATPVTVLDNIGSGVSGC